MANANYVFTETLARTLAHLGVAHAALTPGSRNTPLAIAMAESQIEHSVHIDERSAAFFALGAAKRSGLPAVVVCTSGTAAAEYAPAVHEASISRVPLIVLTADRPPELRDAAAPQTIDQVGIYGRALRWFHELATPRLDLAPYVVRVAAQAWTAAAESPAGPVHINVPMRDPLAPSDRATVESVALPNVELSLPLASDTALANVAGALSGKRVIVLAGASPQPCRSILDLARALDAPVLADPLSNLRTGHDHVVTTGDTIARLGLLDRELRPDVVIRFGPPPTSKALGQWQARNPDVAHVVVDHGGWREPQPIAPTFIRADADATAAALVDRVTPGGAMSAWREAERAIRRAFADLPFPSEPAAARTVADGIEAGSVLWVGSSMPVRDLDTFWHGKPQVTVLGNRGANGIDGFVSAALGSAANADHPTYALAGDLTLLHDATALITARRLDLDLTLVVVNNDGGGIFHFLPQADHPEHFEHLLVVPHGQDLGAIVTGMGAEHSVATRQGELHEAVAGTPKGMRVVEVRTDRHDNAQLHRTLFEQARIALS